MLKTKISKEELAHNKLWVNLGKAYKKAFEDLPPAHVCMMSLDSAIDLCFECAPNEKDINRMLDDVYKMVKKRREKEESSREH
jgi:hypothetical protein